MDIKEKLRKIGKKITPAYITKVALLTAIAFLLYAFAKIKLPFMFPVFLDMQFSELPAILAGFSLGPVAGAIVVILKCLLKFPMSNTLYVGELTDMILGLMYVLPASIIYTLKKSKKSAVIGLIAGVLASTVAAIILNRFVSVPFFVTLYYKGDFDSIVRLCATLYPGLTRKNFYAIYLLAGVLPFNLLRLSIMSILTFLVYKRLSKALHWEITPRKTKADAAEPEAAPLSESAEKSETEAEPLTESEEILDPENQKEE